MLFITWMVRPDLARKFVNERLELDTTTDANGREVAFLSAVCFHVTDVESALLPVPRLSFEQINYRVYVRANNTPAVCFLGMKVNSRMVTAVTSFLNLPINHEDIEIGATADGTGLISYTLRSPGIRATALIGGPENTASDVILEPDFITDRLVGFMGVGNGLYRINVEQNGLKTVAGKARTVEASSLEKLGLLSPDESTRPCSVFYAPEARFAADTPVREY
jgi:hypothetical protein